VSVASNAFSSLARARTFFSAVSRPNIADSERAWLAIPEFWLKRKVSTLLRHQVAGLSGPFWSSLTTSWFGANQKSRIPPSHPLSVSMVMKNFAAMCGSVSVRMY